MMERREALKATAVAALAGSRVLGANDRIRAAQIGCGGRGTYEMRVCAGMPDIDVVAVADVYPPLVERARQGLGGKPEGYLDFRRILDRKDIDVVFVSTPDHWHAIQSIMAMQAGKDVYCEKPLTHNIAEGRRMVQAARKYGRVCQTGSQQRSAPHFQRAVELIRSGYIGKVSSVDTWNYGNIAPAGYGRPKDQDPPPGLDWDMFLGPAPKVPYNRNRFHFNYRWFWDYSGGYMTDWGAHHIDIVHWAMNVNAPLSAAAAGGRLCCDDNCETPDTLTTVFEYPGFTARYSFRETNGRRFESRPYGMAFYGTKGTLILDRSSLEVQPEREVEGRSGDFDRLDAFLKGGENAQYSGLNLPANPKVSDRCEAINETGIRMEPNIQIAHVRNFFDCVRSRKTPVADVETGHRTVSACHVGVIAYKLGRRVRWDAEREMFPGDKQAQALVTRQYRKPWVLPEVPA